MIPARRRTSGAENGRRGIDQLRRKLLADQWRRGKTGSD